MAIIHLHHDVESGRDYYQIDDTEPTGNYPTDCGVGSKAVIVDPDHVNADTYKRFDGSGWNPS